MKSKIKTVFKGTIAHCLGLDEEDFQLMQDCLLGVNEEGSISFIGSASHQKDLQDQFSFADSQVEDLGKKYAIASSIFRAFSYFLFHRILIPGFVDTHIHAPQYAFTGFRASYYFFLFSLSCQ